MSGVIERLGITTNIFNTENCKDVDMVIIANMCMPDNIEATYCRENNIPYFSVGEVIEYLCMDNKQGIVIAGTHGKTTTTGLAITMMNKLAVNPDESVSYLVGGVIRETGKSAEYVPQSQYFVIEGDEYDTAYFDKAPKFLHYKPHISVITSVELDHIELYKDINDYDNAFKFLIDETDDHGVIFACSDDIGVRRIIDQISTDKNIITYGRDNAADMMITDIQTDTSGQTISFVYQGQQYQFHVPLFGEYNAYNALAVYGIGLYVGKTADQLQNVFAGYDGMKRRQEVFGEKNNITVIDDFAHHPTAVEKTLKGLRERFGDRRIIAIFEPRSNTSRSKMFEEDYVGAFTDADMVYISVPPVKKVGFNPDAFMDIEIVSNNIRNTGKDVYNLSSADEIVQHLKDTIKPGDVLVVMSNGDFDGIHQKLLDVC
jgi:UDP-N-acetylmuramate: L-alanyl-gamma-D-glutamyl-meso-diaminopimelate ligase